MTIGERIHDLRLKNGLTLEEVGNAVGVSKSTVKKWEDGHIANMRRDRIAALARTLGVKSADIVGWNDGDSATAIKREHLTYIFDRLNAAGQDRLVEDAEMLLNTPKYSAPAPAHPLTFSTAFDGMEAAATRTTDTPAYYSKQEDTDDQA